MALVVWVTTWRYVVPRMLGTEYHWRSSRFWRDALIYPGINAALLAGAIGIVGVLFLISNESWPIWILPGLLMFVLIGLPVAFALPGLIYLVRKHWQSFNASRSQAVTAYLVVILIANFVYLALAAGYSALIGVI